MNTHTCLHCNHIASFFCFTSSIDIDDEKFYVYNYVPYWSNHSLDGSPGFELICKQCLKKIIAIKKLFGVTCVLMIKDAYNNYSFSRTDMNLKDYLQKYN